MIDTSLSGNNITEEWQTASVYLMESKMLILCVSVHTVLEYNRKSRQNLMPLMYKTL